MNNFSIGLFSTGTCIILGYVHSDVLHGIIIKTWYPKHYKLFYIIHIKKNLNYNYISSLLSRNYFSNFRKINLIQKFFRHATTDDLMSFSTDVALLPFCYDLFGFLFKTNRYVLIEKHTSINKHFAECYLRASAVEELELIKILSRKYGKHIVKKILDRIDKKIIFEYELNDKCLLLIPTIFNKYIFVELNSYPSLGTLYAIWIKSIINKETSEKYQQKIIQ